MENDIIEQWLDLDNKEDNLELRVRNDIPHEIQHKVYLHLLMQYRKAIGDEPPLLRDMDKPIAIGLLEQALRAKMEINLPTTKRITPEKGWDGAARGPY